ncbi:MAG: fumarylacetoacetate (FAA) hydrolase, partial [uncultured Thermomicrobiales bacterium]
ARCRVRSRSDRRHRERRDGRRRHRSPEVLRSARARGPAAGPDRPFRRPAAGVGTPGRRRRRRSGGGGAAAVAADPAVKDRLPGRQLPRGDGPPGPDPRPLLQVAGGDLRSRRHRRPAPAPGQHFSPRGRTGGGDRARGEGSGRGGGAGRRLRLRRLQRRLRPRAGPRRDQLLSRQIVRHLRRLRPLDRDQGRSAGSPGAARHRRRQRGTPPGLLDRRHGAPGPGTADLHLFGDDPPPRRRDLLRHQPPGPRRDAGRRRGRDRDLRHRRVHDPRPRRARAGLDPRRRPGDGGTGEGDGPAPRRPNRRPGRQWRVRPM